MGYYSTPSVHWRLPSLSEYDIADVDGIRYVMGDMGGLAGINDQEWTATLDSFSSNRRNAFTFSSMKGTVSSQDRATTTVYARCVAAVTSSTGPFSGTTNTINKPAYYFSASKMNASCTNMRFTDSNGNSAPFYLDSGCNTSSTLVWVRVPGFTSSTSLNWYYGLLTTGTSDFNGTFPSSYTATATTGYVGTATYDSFSVPASTFVAGATGTPVYVTANRIAISGSINVTGAGYPGAVAVSTAGSGPGGGSAATTFGGAGAGYGGAGGCGQTSLNVCNSTAGTTYGNSSALPTNAATLKDSMGSGGGGGSADSGLGNGGGAVILVGKVVKVAGTIVGNGADGNKASIASGSQGGGSGGTIQFSADTALSLTGTLSVNGGRPGNGYAGGGGGGRIKILSPATPVIPTVDTSTKNFLGATTDSSGTSIGNVSARGSNGGTNSGTTTNATTYTLGSETQTTITSP
ncbi:MAG: DUF2341 domain-containing protein [Candidatus Melainabacteria bacterium]|nr:DUF2341 domain-containing protein [Candidatus Melainabacteria bacterium]